LKACHLAGPFFLLSHLELPCYPESQEFFQEFSVPF